MSQDSSTPPGTTNETATESAQARELRLQREAAEWNAPTERADIPQADFSDIPVIDVGRYLAAVEAVTAGSTPTPEQQQELANARAETAAAVKTAGLTSGFCYLAGFGRILSEEMLGEGFAATRAFHTILPEQEKLKIEMDNPSAGGAGGLVGVGYLREKNTKLPARPKANYNSCYLLKREEGPRDITLDKMPWPESYSAGVACTSTPDDADEGDEKKDDSVLYKNGYFDGPAFRQTVTQIALGLAFDALATALLPLYATALDQPVDYFDRVFHSPMFRMRLAQYHPTPTGEFGINPHVDTSFFTLLATTDPSGLVVFSHTKKTWVRARSIPGALIVNTGETLSRITNDLWPATRHYVLSGEDSIRYSLPFFFNPTASARVGVCESCCGSGHPEGLGPKYEPVSYLEGQGVVQGE